MAAGAGWYAPPVHISLFPDGELLFIGVARSTESPFEPHEEAKISFAMSPTPIGELVPPEVKVAELDVPYDLDEQMFFHPAAVCNR